MWSTPSSLSSSLTSIQTPTSTVTPNPNITHFLNIKFDKGNYLLCRFQFLPLLNLHDLKNFIDGTSLCPVRFLPSAKKDTKPTINPEYNRWIKLDQSFSYDDLSPHSPKIFLLISSASPHSALWSESLRHPPELACSNSNSSCAPSRWSPPLCQSTFTLSSPSWTVGGSG